MHRNDFVRQLSSPGGDRRPSRIMHIDIPLLLILIALCSIGLAVLYSASAESIFYVKRQATFMFIGLFAMIVIAQFQPRLWERWSIFIYLCGLLSLVAVLFFGVGAKGAQRWLDLGVTRFQPSELMKIAVPMTLASYLGKRHMPPRFKHVTIGVIATLIPVFLVARQPDLGTSLIIFSSGFFALFLAGLGKRYLLSTALLAMAAVPTLWFYVMYDYQKQRVLTLLSPSRTSLAPAGILCSQPRLSALVASAVKAGPRGLSRNLTFCPRAIRILLLPCWQRSLA